MLLSPSAPSQLLLVGKSRLQTENPMTGYPPIADFPEALQARRHLVPHFVSQNAGLEWRLGIRRLSDL